jgi:hypothetical protein
MEFAKQHFAYFFASTTHLGLVNISVHLCLPGFTKTLVTRLHFQRTQDRPQRRLVSLNLWYALHIRFNETGGASRDRTDDPLLAKQVLSQLSYGPVIRVNIPNSGGSRWTRTTGLTLIRGAL